jgi:hypothetical protein
MADMFGGPVGTLEFEKGLLARLSGAVNVQEGLGRIAQQPYELRKKAAEAETSEMTLANQKKMAELMMASSAAKPSIGQVVTMADRFDKLAENAAGAGLTEEARKLAGTASQLRQREAAAVSSRVNAIKTNLEIVRSRANLIGQLLADVNPNDEASWRRANELFEFETGEPSPYTDQPYSPALVDQVRRAALTVKERADIADKAATRAATKNYRSARLRQLDRANEIRKQEAETRKAAEERRAKGGGGKSVTSPNRDEQDQAERLIKGDFGKLDAADLEDASFSIASEARALRRANPALSPSMAIRQAYNEAVKAGDFPADTSGLFGEKRRFTGRGKTPETAFITVPEASKRLKGRYYTGAGGQVARWTGSGWSVIDRPLSEDNSRLNDEDEDEDEED